MEQKRICVNKFSVEPPSQYSYSEMGSKIFHRCFEVDGVGVPAGKPIPASQRAKTSIPIHPRGLSAGRADPFVLGGRLTAYRLALTVKGCATDQEAGHYRPRAPPQERQHPMLSRNQGIQVCPPERGKGPSPAGRGFPPGFPASTCRPPRLHLPPPDASRLTPKETICRSRCF